jgi:hypothetical protein
MSGSSGVFFKNKIMVFGGNDEQHNFSNDLNIYDIETK